MMGHAQLVITSGLSAPLIDVAFVQTSQPSSYYGVEFSNSVPRGIGQTFTPSASFDLGSIVLPVGAGVDNDAWLGATVTFEIYQMTDGNDTQPDATLFSGTASLPSVAGELDDGRYLNFEIDPTSLVAGTTYGWGVFTVDKIETKLPFRNNDHNVMSDGRFLVYWGGWVSSPNASVDMSFHAVKAVAVPEPSAWAALAGLLGLGAAVVRRRRQAAKPRIAAPQNAA